MHTRTHTRTCELCVVSFRTREKTSQHSRCRLCFSLLLSSAGNIELNGVIWGEERSQFRESISCSPSPAQMSWNKLNVLRGQGIEMCKGKALRCHGRREDKCILYIYSMGTTQISIRCILPQLNRFYQWHSSFTEYVRKVSFSVSTAKCDTLQYVRVFSKRFFN